MANTTEAQRGHRFTPRGTMPPGMLKRHKLTKNTLVDLIREDKEFNGWESRRRVKKTIEMYSLYRTLYHKVTEKHLARSLVLTAQYFAQVNKPEFKNRDKVAKDGTEPEGAPA